MGLGRRIPIPAGRPPRECGRQTGSGVAPSERYTNGVPIHPSYATPPGRYALSAAAVTDAPLFTIDLKINADSGGTS